MKEDWIQIKQSIVNHIKIDLNSKLLELETATLNSKQYSQAEDMKQESKYDTRAIEASYLHGAQEARLKQVRNDLSFFKSLELKKNNHVSTGALVELESNSMRSLYFISPCSVLKQIQLDSLKINLVTINSVIGEAMLGLETNDDFALEGQGIEKHFQIIAIY